MLSFEWWPKLLAMSGGTNRSGLPPETTTTGQLYTARAIVFVWGDGPITFLGRQDMMVTKHLFDYPINKMGGVNLIHNAKVRFFN